MSAGFPTLQKIAQEWANNDSNFYQLIVRKVSKDNYGIQFIYYVQDGDKGKTIDKYKQILQEKFNEGLYAWDIHDSSEDKPDKIKKMIIKNIQLPFSQD